MLNNFEFQHSRTEIKVTVAIFRKKMPSLQCPHLLSNLNISIQVLGMTIPQKHLRFSMIGSRSRSQ